METQLTDDTYGLVVRLKNILKNINITVDPDSQIGQETKEGIEIINEWQSRQI